MADHQLTNGNVHLIIDPQGQQRTALSGTHHGPTTTFSSHKFSGCECVLCVHLSFLSKHGTGVWEGISPIAPSITTVAGGEGSVMVWAASCHDQKVDIKVIQGTMNAEVEVVQARGGYTHY